MNRLISIIIVSYNTKALTLDCLRSVFDQTEITSFKVHVIDNNSSDGSAEAISKEFPQVHLIKSAVNHGFAKANNLVADTIDSKYILLLNPDTVVLDGAIDTIYQFAEKNEASGIWGGKTLYGDHTLNPNSCFRQMSLWNLFCRALGLSVLGRNTELFNGEEFGGWQRDTERQVDIVSGCFLLISRSLWVHLKGFDERFFMYAEDADLCLRASRIGYNPRVTPLASIIHYGGASECIRSDKMVRLLRAKSDLLIVHWNTLPAFLGRVLIGTSAVVRLLIFLILDTLTKGDKYREKRNVWFDIWQRRSSWFHGNG
mgnify:CR=1 FL=1